MRRLYRYLPPFAGDYSGVCSALYELGGMLCIHDAAGCTGNYVGFDEPRSYHSDKLIYCTGLRRTDAILGNEEVYIDKILRAAAEMKPRFIALVGSPVPYVIGFDFNGVAKEIERRADLPVFGFATNGMQGCYKDGVVMAVGRLIEHYAPDVLQAGGRKKRVNVLGATRLDFDMENLNAFLALLRENGYQVTGIPGMGNSVEEVCGFAQADINLAVTQAGLLLAMELEKKYGLPYLAGLPVGTFGSRCYFDCLRRVAETKESCLLSWEAAGRNVKTQQRQGGCKERGAGRAVVLEDAVIAASIRAELLAEGYEEVALASPFGEDQGTKLFAAECPRSEKEILETVNRADCHFIAADPLLLSHRRRKEGDILLELPKYAVSSKLMHHRRWVYIGDGWNEKVKM